MKNEKYLNLIYIWYLMFFVLHYSCVDWILCFCVVDLPNMIWLLIVLNFVLLFFPYLIHFNYIITKNYYKSIYHFSFFLFWFLFHWIFIWFLDLTKCERYFKTKNLIKSETRNYIESLIFIMLLNVNRIRSKPNFYSIQKY